MARSSKTAVQSKPLLQTVTAFYLRSGDFNGMPVVQLTLELGLPWKELQAHLSKLVKARRLDLAFASHSDNPHIKRIAPLEPAAQAERLTQEDPRSICAYPVAGSIGKAMNMHEYDDRPYSQRLLLVEPQLQPVFFDLGVLDRYFRDPRYHFDFEDYEGSISVRSEHYESEDMPERDKAFLQSFGIGYDQARRRVVVVFLRYLASLSSEHQLIWRSHEVTGPCTLNSDYEGASIWGRWPEFHSAYRAFLQEQVEINTLAKRIGRPALFKESYGERRPSGFHPMLRPTQRNLDDFLHLLDKLMSENIERGFFQDDIPLKGEEIQDDGKIKIVDYNTITLMERWLRKCYRAATGEDVSKEVVAAFREVRKLRQKPAHTVVEDRYEPSFAKQQDQLLERALRGLTELRLVLSSHPRAKGYAPPEWLDGEEIVFY